MLAIPHIKLYPNFQTAVEAGNRPCNTCKAPYYTVEELEQANAEKRKKEEEKKQFEERVKQALEERKKQILTGTKKDLSNIEAEWLKEYLSSRNEYESSKEDESEYRCQVPGNLGTNRW